MRPLKKMFILIQLVSSTAICAGSVTLESSQTQSLQLNEINVPTSAKVLSVSSPTVFEITKINVAFSQLQQDLSNRNIILKNSSEIPLSTLDAGLRETLLTGFEISLGNYSSTFTTTQDLKKSLFTGKTYALEQSVQFHSGATRLNLSVSSSEQNQPLSFFIDPESLESKERLTVIKTTQVGLGVEQIWTEIFKTKFNGEYKKAENFRPQQISLRILQATALGQFWTWKSELGLADETRSEPLKDDRGYFQSAWFDQEFSYEWKLDSFITLGWSTLDESETDPRRNRKVVLGTDELAISLRQTFEKFNYDLQFSYFLNSENQTATAYKGVLAWAF